MTTDLRIAEWGYARIPLAELAPLRRRIPAWAPADTPNHFFKYSDEQTVLAVQAIDSLVARSGSPPQPRPVIAAPQLFGRLGGSASLHKFRSGGGSAVSPHTIPQHSLHSVSGAISILLGSHAANVGVGGGPNALAEGMLAAATLFSLETSGVWLVCTGFDPEPLPGDIASASQAIGYAAVLALEAATVSALEANGSLRLKVQPEPTGARSTLGATLPALVSALADAETSNTGAALTWNYPGGISLELELPRGVAVRRAA